jgi:hypothetical protein
LLNRRTGVVEHVLLRFNVVGERAFCDRSAMSLQGFKTYFIYEFGECRNLMGQYLLQETYDANYISPLRPSAKSQALGLVVE